MCVCMCMCMCMSCACACACRYDGLTLKVRVGYSEPQHYDYYLAINELKTKEV